MLRAFSRLLSTPLNHPGTPPSEVVTLIERVDKLERAELDRAAEHHAMVDRLERLYKRVSTRIAREAAPADEPTPLELRNRKWGSR